MVRKKGEEREMKKSFCSLLALVALFTLTGCDDPSSNTSNSGGETPQEINLVWWNDYEQPANGEADRGNAAYNRYFFAQDAIDAFEELYPNVHITQECHNSYGEIATDIQNGLSTGNIPNIASTYPDNVLAYEQAGVVLHAQEYFNDPEVGFGKIANAEGEIVDDPSSTLADLNLSSEESAYGDGDYLTMPYSRSSETLIVNQSVFDLDGAGEAGHTASSDPSINGGEQYIAPVAVDTKTPYEIPTDYTEVIALARRMKADFPETFADQRDEDGWFKAVPFCYDSPDNLFISFTQMMGIDYTDNTKPLFNNQDAKNMMIQLKKWNNEGLICTADQLQITNPTEGWHEYSTSVMNYGRIFMLVSSTTSGQYLGVDGYRATFTSTPTIGKKDMEIFSSSDAGEHYAISQGPSLVLFANRDEAVEKATFNFYKFLTNTENSASLAASSGYFPIRESSNDEEAVKNYIDAANEPANETSTDSEAHSAKINNYIGQTYKLNETYIENDDYFVAPVYSGSAACRTAVGNLVNYVFNTEATTDAEITALVDEAFATAYSAALQ